MATTKKDVTTTDPEHNRLPAAQHDYGMDAGVGMEGAKADEFLIPFFRILQTNSPEVDEGDGKYIHNARPGMILNTATREAYDGKVGIGFVISARDHNFIEFIPRSAGSGFVDVWSPDDPRLPKLREIQLERAARRGFGKLKLSPADANSNEVVEVYKFRSMRDGVDGVRAAEEEDERFTRVGGWLRSLPWQAPNYIP